ncbi:MAG: ComEC/Rec2 family competence protein [Actinomycetaceae bacterium]|nr:ComEC/Rec2 family competence protein [Actinomycetaceae bacterium]
MPVNELSDERADFSDYRLLVPAAGAWGSAASILSLMTTRVRPQVLLIVGVLIAMLICAIALYPLTVYRPRHSTYPAGSVRAAIMLALMVGALAGLSSVHSAVSYMNSALTTCRTQCHFDAVVTHRSHRVSHGWFTRVRPREMRYGQLVLSTREPIDGEPGDTVRGVGAIKPFGAAPTVGLMKPERIAVSSQPSRTHTFRTRFFAQLTHLPPDVRGLIIGISIGDSSEMSDTSRTAMRRTSTTHITAISGMHLGIIMMTIQLLLPGRPRSKIVLLTLIVGVLIGVVGPQPSIIRAASMAAVMAVGYATGRPGQARAALATVVMTWLIINPWLAWSVGFALSVTATAGVLAVVDSRRQRSNTRAGRVRRRLIGMVAVPLAAALTTAPILVTVTGQLPLFAVPANIAILPAVAPTTLAGLAAAICATYAPAATAIPLAVADVGARWILAVTEWFAHLPCATIEQPYAHWALGIEFSSITLVLIWRVLPFLVRHRIPHETLSRVQRIE